MTEEGARASKDGAGAERKAEQTTGMAQQVGRRGELVEASSAVPMWTRKRKRKRWRRPGQDTIGTGSARCAGVRQQGRVVVDSSEAWVLRKEAVTARSDGRQARDGDDASRVMVQRVRVCVCALPALCCDCAAWFLSSLRCMLETNGMGQCCGFRCARPGHNIRYESYHVMMTVSSS